MSETIDFCNNGCALAENCITPIEVTNPAISAENLCPKYLEDSINPSSSKSGNAAKILELALNRGDRDLLQESKETMLQVVAERTKPRTDGKPLDTRRLFASSLHTAYTHLSFYDLFEARLERRRPNAEEIDSTRGKLESALKITNATFLAAGENFNAGAQSQRLQKKNEAWYSTLKGKISLMAGLLLALDGGRSIYPSSFREVQGFWGLQPSYRGLYHNAHTVIDDDSRETIQFKSGTKGYKTPKVIYVQNLGVEAMREIDPETEVTMESLVGSLFNNPEFRTVMSSMVVDAIDRMPVTPSRA